MTEQLSDSTPFLSAGASRVVLAGVVAALQIVVDVYVARVSAQGDDPRGLHRN